MFVWHTYQKSVFILSNLMELILGQLEMTSVNLKNLEDNV